MDRLTRVISALAGQTYPVELIEVVVADDSSVPPLDASSYDAPFPVRVVRQDVDRFAAGRARSLAARAATGEVLMFLDADVLPSPVVMESYLRWFDRCAMVVPFGFLSFVDMSSLPQQAIVRALRARDMSLLDGLDSVDDQEWREQTFSMTSDLRRESSDMFRTLVGASLAVSAEQYAEVGGFADLGVRGVEDIEFGYRLQNNGAIFIPERSARHWHDGGRTMSGDRIARIRRDRRPYTDALLPIGDFRGDRPLASSPVPIAPRLRVYVDPLMARAAELAKRIRDADGADVEVVIGAADDDFTSAFAQVELDAWTEWCAGAARAITDQLVRQNVGTLLIVGGEASPLIEVVGTRAIRAARPSSGSRSITRKLFGVGVVDASSVHLVSKRSQAAALIGRSRQFGVIAASKLRRSGRRFRQPTGLDRKRDTP